LAVKNKNLLGRTKISLIINKKLKDFEIDAYRGEVRLR